MSERTSHRLIRRFMPLLIYDLTFTKGKGHALQIKSLVRICPETKFTSHSSARVCEHYRVSLEAGIQRAQAAIRQTTDLSADRALAALFNNRLESDPVKMETSTWLLAPPPKHALELIIIVHILPWTRPFLAKLSRGMTVCCGFSVCCS